MNFWSEQLEEDKKNTLSKQLQKINRIIFCIRFNIMISDKELKRLKAKE